MAVGAECVVLASLAAKACTLRGPPCLAEDDEARCERLQGAASNGVFRHS